MMLLPQLQRPKLAYSERDSSELLQTGRGTADLFHRKFQQAAALTEKKTAGLSTRQAVGHVEKLAVCEERVRALGQLQPLEQAEATDKTFSFREEFLTIIFSS
ncbi:hypothetical protein MHYP_G00345840 [Metynnis hypsauchen]